MRRRPQDEHCPVGTTGQLGSQVAVAPARTVPHFWGVVLVVVIASSCGASGSSAQPDPNSSATTAGASSAETQVGGSATPSPDSLTEAIAPHGLGQVEMPDSASDIEALFGRLPSDLTGRPRTGEFPRTVSGRINASYGVTGSRGCATVGLQAVNVSAGDFFPGGSTSEFVIAMFSTGQDWDVQDSGRDGELFWVTFTTTCGTAGSPGEDVVSTLNWGIEGSPWLFSASADTTEDVDELTAAFVTAAD
jgi:hypothetical protein